MRCAVCTKPTTHFWDRNTGLYACSQEHARLRDEWEVRRGIIRRPGKFEGERAYLPRFYEAYLDGLAEDKGDRILLEVTPEERQEFPALKRRHWVSFVIDDQGFVRE